MRWIGKALLWAVVALLALALIGATYQAIATELDERAYPPPGNLVDVGGHRLHIHCLGEGSPTVILEAANGGMSAHWVRVQQEAARATRVCAYDRAGLGWSERGPKPRDARQIHTLAHRAQPGDGVKDKAWVVLAVGNQLVVVGFETKWGCAAAVPAPRTASIAVMSRATVANKMMRLIVSHLLPYVTVATYSRIGVGASLKCSIYY